MAIARKTIGKVQEAPAARQPESFVAPNGMAFSISRAKGAAYDAGLRGFMAYRDLGINAATQGRVHAHILRAVPGTEHPAAWHMHLLEFQMVLVLKGWIKFNYETVGEVTLYPGDCINQAPTIRHIEIAHSDDFEGLEIVMPAEFRTIEVTPPAE
jgi:hypothetical protein